LRQWPEREAFRALEGFTVKVTAALLFKGNAEGLAVQFATCRNVTDDRTEAGDEQNLYSFTALRLRALLCRFH